jgi:hypothetical protein
LLGIELSASTGVLRVERRVLRRKSMIVKILLTDRHD